MPWYRLKVTWIWMSEKQVNKCTHISGSGQIWRFKALKRSMGPRAKGIHLFFFIKRTRTLTWPPPSRAMTPSLWAWDPTPARAVSPAHLTKQQGKFHWNSCIHLIWCHIWIAFSSGDVELWADQPPPPQHFSSSFLSLHTLCEEANY